MFSYPRSEPTVLCAALRSRSRIPSRGRSEGFSLLEVVFAVVILTVLTLAVLLVILPVSRQLRVNREMDLATTETRKVLEKIQSVPFFDVTTLYPEGTEITVAGLAQGRLTVNYDDPAADPLVLRANLTWDSPDLGTINRNFITVRTE